MNKAIVVEPITTRGKALVVKRIAGGRYRVCCECTSVANAEYIRDALNKEEPDANQR